MLADSQFTCEGILDAPHEFVAALVSGAHSAGALVFADEARSGHDRSGLCLWRFRATGVTPDLVKLGTPMGAGYQIGVVTCREFADVPAVSSEYFSIFATTPAAAAAGHAVLDVPELTGLPARAVVTGCARARVNWPRPNRGPVKSGAPAGSRGSTCAAEV